MNEWRLIIDDGVVGSRQEFPHHRGGKYLLDAVRPGHVHKRGNSNCFDIGRLLSRVTGGVITASRRRQEQHRCQESKHLH